MQRKRLLVSVCALLAPAVTGTGCGRRASAVAGYHDQVPLPAEPLVYNLPSVGRYGGRFVFGETNNPRTFNAPMANEQSSTDITDDRLFIALLDLNNITQELGPGLAKTWEVAPDRLTWTFHLRKGAAFSDGHPITAEDVLFNFQVAYDETLHPSIQDLLKINGKPFDVSAPDPYTVVVKTPIPVATLLNAIGSVYIMPKHILEAAFKDGSFASAYNVSTPPDKIVTSGPWRVTQYVPGEKTVLGRNPYWYGVDQQNHRLPYLDELVFLAVPDQDALDLKFRSGEHGLDNPKPENYRWYQDHQREGNFTLYDLGPDINTNFFWFNLNKVQKPTPGKKLGDPFVEPTKYVWFKNPIFRRAVSMAIDRDAMIPSVFFGQATKNFALATAANKVWHNPDLVHYDYDVEGAKKLLASLGWKDSDGDGVLEDTQGHPISFTMKTNADNVLRVGMANFIKDDLAKVGIKVTLVPVDFNTLITNSRNDFQYHAILLGLQSGTPPDPSMMQNVWRSNGLTHEWFISELKPDTAEDVRINQLMDVIVTDLDLAARKQAYKEIETIANQQAWFIWLPIRRMKVPISNRFGNLQPSVIPHRLLWNIDRVYVKASN